MTSVDLARYLAALPAAAPVATRGRVVELSGAVLRATLEGVGQGELVEIRSAGAGLLAEVVGFRGAEVVLAPLGSTAGIAAGAEVLPTGRPLALRVGAGLLGRVLDALGRPVDRGAPPDGLVPWPLDRPPPNPLERGPIEKPFQLGLRVLDGLLTAGAGQRLGLFAGSGVGKSTLLGQIVRGSEAEVVVVGLVGERGREVREVLDGVLGGDGRRRSVVVVATSDAPALVRVKAAHAATAVAEWFADVAGRSVLLVLDSLTRVARSQREVGLAAGEPPGRHGYPASVFSALPRLLERAGPRASGHVTAVYTVLVAGGDLDEPVADEVRGLLDGHVVLDRAAAGGGRFPAVDVLRSVSRLMPAVACARHQALAARLRALLAVWERQRDLIALGAYARGSDPATDEAIARIDRVEAYLRQPASERSTLQEAVAGLEAVFA
jgi:type III secretion protein N (ATPase)